MHTIEHCPGHLEIPLAAAFAAEGIDTAQHFSRRPDIVQNAYAFGLELAEPLHRKENYKKETGARRTGAIPACFPRLF